MTHCVPLMPLVPTDRGAVGVHHPERWEMKPEGAMAPQRSDPVSFLSPLTALSNTSHLGPQERAAGITKLGSAMIQPMCSLKSFRSRESWGPCQGVYSPSGRCYDLEGWAGPTWADGHRRQPGFGAQGIPEAVNV